MSDERIKRGDIGMVQIGLSPCFRAEAFHQVGIPREIGTQDLDGDDTVERGVYTLIDHTHPTLAELLEDTEIQEFCTDHGALSRSIAKIRGQAGYLRKRRRLNGECGAQLRD